jgi:hypothetical protein
VEEGNCGEVVPRQRGNKYKRAITTKISEYSREEKGRVEEGNYGEVVPKGKEGTNTNVAITTEI